jgi:hypothetical protein
MDAEHNEREALALRRVALHMTAEAETLAEGSLVREQLTAWAYEMDENSRARLAAVRGLEAVGEYPEPTSLPAARASIVQVRSPRAHLA